MDDAFLRPLIADSARSPFFPPHQLSHAVPAFVYSFSSSSLLSSARLLFHPSTISPYVSLVRRLYTSLTLNGSIKVFGQKHSFYPRRCIHHRNKLTVIALRNAGNTEWLYGCARAHTFELKWRRFCHVFR